MTRSRNFRRNARRGFTLIEILVALAIFALLIAVVFVPLRLGLNTFSTGNAQVGVQSAVSTTTAAMERELRTAIYVFPNAAVPGVSNLAPYDREATFRSLPYVELNLAYDAANVADSLTDNANQLTGNVGVCSVATSATNAKPTANLSRLDFLVPRMNGASVQTPLTPEYYLVSYYARRLDPTRPFDPIENPWVLCRAQMPYLTQNGTAKSNGATTGAYDNVATGQTRYPTAIECRTGSTKYNIEARWLLQDRDGQPLLGATFTGSGSTNGQKDLAKDVTDGSTTRGSDALLSPQGVGLALSRSTVPSQRRPTLTFACEDSSGDGQIDRVTIRLAMTNLSGEGQTRNGEPLSVAQGLPQVIDLRNVRGTR